MSGDKFLGLKPSMPATAEFISGALRPFEDGTKVVIRLNGSDYFVERIEYAPSKGDEDAYVILHGKGAA